MKKELHLKETKNKTKIRNQDTTELTLSNSRTTRNLWISEQWQSIREDHPKNHAKMWSSIKVLKLIMKISQLKSQRLLATFGTQGLKIEKHLKYTDKQISKSWAR
jgi:hypothetical protein